ncbi:MAG: hypothetical protein LQ342_002467 [Letrouitia transgressa]|nr:MAG: hypothetical protein LQ342_002467 [Letrouitia transgressa]
MSPSPAPASYPGDSLIPSASMVYDRTRLIRAPASAIFPWILQLGARRGGWYLTSSLERLVPRSWAATRRIEPQWQNLTVGDRVPDYGFRKDEWFEVAAVDPPRALVYRSERYGCVFSWAILLEEPGEGEAEGKGMVVHLRFRGRIGSQGWKRRVIVWGGDLLDHWTTKPMLAGLAERVEREHRE